MPENITQLTAIGIIFVFAIREFFAYLREKSHKKNGESTSPEYRKDIKEIFNKMGEMNIRIAGTELSLDNHCKHLDRELTTIREQIRRGEDNSITIKNSIVEIEKAIIKLSR